MTERWRLFVAVPVGEELRDALASAVADWRRRPDLVGLRWSEPDAWHLTLLFLGATDSSDVASISGALGEIAARHDAATLETGGLGGFVSPSRAHVAWYGVADPEHRLQAVALDVRSKLAVGDESGFRAHITLGRSRGEPIDLRAWIAEAQPPRGRLAVAELRLMRSHLGRGPARYETLHAAPLRASAHV